jgi:cell volume regulation protein A
MAGAEIEIGAIGLIILIGVIGRLFLKKTAISDIFLLIIFGAFCGIFLSSEFVLSFQPLLLELGALTLLMIILDEGLHLSLKELFLQLHKAVFFSFLSFALSFILTLFACAVLFKLDLMLSFLISSIFASVAPELLSSFFSARETEESTKSMAEIEATLSDSFSVILTFIFLEAIIHHQAQPQPDLLFAEIVLIFFISLALGALGAFIWKLSITKIAQGNEHLVSIGLAAIIYAISHNLGANSVISVFAFGFFIGNSGHKSIIEVKEFHSEISFFLRTFFFIYLGILIFHSPKSIEVGLFAMVLSVLLAFARAVASRIFSKFEPSIKKGRLIESVSSRGLTSAVLAVLVSEELHLAKIELDFNLPLVALFVIFITNAISAFLVFKNRKKE